MRLYTRRFLKPYNEVVVPDDGDKRALAHIAAKRLEREQKMREAVGMRRLRLMKPMKRIFAEQIPSGDPAAHSGDVLLKSVELATNANKLQLGVLPVR
ncbi:hypothetical protein CCAX7_15210 [Capsulimonas corticalis]|uniref:Uncharacterized protein n=2 Tax=Capsulimonas corticalis TaxID=2219043 RepID=A0A402CZ85_9BACT|nr:hypothetical protein CCAX7_15210 [Capsulimonas corticalis]